MIKELIKDPEQLSVRCNEWLVKADPTLAKTISEDLIDTMEANNLYGLTGNMIGYSQRAIALRFKDGIHVLLNPAYQTKGDMEIIREKSYLNDSEYLIPRFHHVVLAFQDVDGSVKAGDCGTCSELACKLMDMIDGVDTSFYGLEILPEFDLATDEEKEELKKAYLDNLKNSSIELSKQLSEDPETKQEWDAYRYLRGVMDGTIETIKPEKEGKKPGNRKQRRFLKKFIKRYLKKGASVEVKDEDL